MTTTLPGDRALAFSREAYALLRMIADASVVALALILSYIGLAAVLSLPSLSRLTASWWWLVSQAGR